MSWKQKPVIIPWIFVLAYMGLLFYSSSSGPTTALSILGMYNLDKVAHAGAFGFLCFLLLFALGRSGMRPGGYGAALVAFTVTALYGAIDEYHQSFVCGRQDDVLDFIFNVIGAGVVAVLWLKLAGKRPLLFLLKRGTSEDIDK